MDSTSLQTPPFQQAQATNSVRQDQPAAKPADFTTIAAGFDPSKQQFIWVLPPGVHGKGPWGMSVRVKHRGELKHEMEFPLAPQVTKGGARAEFPAGYEVIRLVDDGRWAHSRTAELDKKIQQLIAEHGRGEGEIQFTSIVKLSLDAPARTKYCVEHQKADIRFYLETAGKPGLEPIMVGADNAMTAMFLKEACDAT